jgi:hypothetical protein
MLADGGNLFLRLRNASATWLFYRQTKGKKRVLVFGKYPEMSLKDARRKRHGVVDGTAPVETKPATFAAAAASFFEGKRVAKLSSTPGNIKAVDHYCKRLMPVAVTAITLKDVANVLEQPRKLDPDQPLWSGHHSGSGENLRSVIERVLTKAGIPKGSNPARWRHGLDDLLDEHVANAGNGSGGTGHADEDHHDKLPADLMPKLMARLRGENDSRKTMAAAFLQTLLMTMVRFDEARAAQWSEFDFEAKTWTIPAQRMKTRKEHAVPLSSQVIAILQSLSRASDFVFPGKSAKIIGRAVIERYWDELRQTIGQPTATMHATGRSTSATWFQEHGYDQTMIDRCLAHAVGSAVTNSYQRSQMVEARRPLMQQWADFATGAATPCA